MWQPTHVKVTVKQAKGLLSKGKNDTNNAFVVIGIGKEKYQTSIKEKAPAQNTDWREECELEIPSQGNKANIQLTVYHHNSLGIDEFLGQAILPLNNFDVYEKPKYRYHKLKGKPEKDKKKGEKERGELEVMVNFIVKSGSFLDISKKEKQKSTTSLKNFGGSLLSLGSKDNKGLKKFAMSVDQRINKITKPKRKKSKTPSTNDQNSYTGELMASQQRYGDADPGVISDDDDDFRFDEEINVYPRSGSPHSSTLSRESSLAHDQIYDDDVSSFASQESSQAFSGGKPAPPKPPRIIDQVEEKRTNLEKSSIVHDPFATAVAPTISPIQEDLPASPLVKVNVIPSSPEYLQSEPPNFMTNRSTSYDEAISLPKKREAPIAPNFDSVFELPMHSSPSLQESSEKSVLTDNSLNEDSQVAETMSNASKSSVDILKRKKSDSRKDKDSQRTSSYSDGSPNHCQMSMEPQQVAYLDNLDKDSTYDSIHTRSLSDESSRYTSSIIGQDGNPFKNSESNQEDSGLFSTPIETSKKPSKNFAFKHDANRPAVVKKQATSTRSYPVSSSTDSISHISSGSVELSDDLSKSITRSGSLSEKRVSDPIVDEWEQKLYGKVTGSTENVSMTGSRSSINTSRSSSIHDLYRDDSFTRLPEVKPISIDRKGEMADYSDHKKPKKKAFSGIKKRFFDKGSGSPNKSLQEEDSRIVEGGNDRLPSPPTRTSRLPQEIHNKYSGKSREDLLEMILNLEGAIQKQVQHTNDLEEYIDNLLLRVMDATPHILQVPITPHSSVKEKYRQ